MPDISARFGADFSDFKTAVDQAAVTLKSFEDDAAKVGDSLDRMANRFSGVKVIQEAELMTKAIASVGGATTLTEKEMAKVNATVSEAVKKYALLGQEAPADMIALAKATEQTQTSTQGFSTSIVALGTFIGDMASQAIGALGRLAVEGFSKLVGAIDDFLLKGSEVADVSENFDRLTAAAGLSGETLLGVLAEGTHSTIDNLTLMKAVNADLAAGLRLSEGQYRTLAEGAFALAQATGTDVTAAMAQMSEAMRTGRTRAVELLTGQVDLERAEKTYAAQLGTTRDRLTEQERLYAAQQAILGAVGGAVARLGEQTDGLDERVSQANVAWTNFSDKLAATIATSPVLGAGLDSLARSLSQAFGPNQATLIETIRKGVDQLALKVVDAGLVFVEWGKTGASVFGGLQVVGQGFADAFIWMAERIMAGNAALSELAAKAPFASAALKENAVIAREMADSWAASREESAKTLEEGRRLMSGQSDLHAVLTRTTDVLVNMKADMTAASLATRAQTTATTAATTATTTFTTATTGAREATEAEQKALDDLLSVGVDFHDTLAKMNPEIVEQARALLAAGASASSIQTVYKLTASEIRAVGLALKEEEKAAEDAARAHDKWAKQQLKASQDAASLWREYYQLQAEMSGTAYDRQVADIERWRAEAIASAEAAGTATEDVYNAIEAVAYARLQAISVDWQDLNDNSQRALQQTADAAARTYDAAYASGKTYTDGYLELLERQKYETQAAVDAIGSTYTVGFQAIGSSVAASMQGATASIQQAAAATMGWSEAMDLARKGQGTFGGTLPSGAWTADRRAETTKAFQEGRYFGPVRQGLFGREPDWAALGAEGRAGGGAVTGGRPYVVGEQGPELFVPSAGGAIVPSSSGAPQVTVNINGSVLGNKQEIARVVGEALMASLRGGGLRLPVGA
jgi:hypothetical protein